MANQRVIAGVGVVALVGLGVWLALRNDEPRTSSGEVRRPADEAEESGHERAYGAIGAGSPHDGGPLVDKKRRDAVLAALQAMYAIDAAATPAGGASPPDPPPAAPRPGSGTMPDSPEELRRYIRERVREGFYPLARSCYESALARDKSLAGKVVLQMRIVGDKKVGGVVDTADVDRDASTMADPELLECMSQSMQSVVFDAPKKGGYVTVTYPFLFSPDDEPEGGMDGGR